MDIKKVIEQVREVPGDFAEFGVYEGNITLQMAESGRHTWAWDTFEGMPNDGYIEELDKSDPPGKWIPNIDTVEKLSSSGWWITTVKGKFSQTIPRIEQEYPNLRYAFVHIDCDHYHAYRRVLDYVTPRMSPGGVVRMDDLGCCEGAKKAAKEWASTNRREILDNQWIYF